MQEAIRKKLSREETQKRIINSLSEKASSRDINKNELTKKQKEILSARRPESQKLKYKNIRKTDKNYNLISNIEFIINKNRPIYLGFGGMGDFVLTLAAYDTKRTDSHIIFFANESSLEFIKSTNKIFDSNLSIFPNIYGSQLARDIYKAINSSGCLMPSNHLPDHESICYNDWKNIEKYKKIMVFNADWTLKYGKNKSLPDSDVIGLTPSGSWKSQKTRKFLTREEFNTVYLKILESKKTPFIFSNISDYKYYCVGNKNLTKGFYLTNKEIFNFEKKTNIPIDTKFFITAIHNCEKIISTDTWIKTYACLINLPTTVIANRDYNGKDIKYGEWGADYIFLNTDFWPTLKVVSYKDLIESII